MPAGRPRGSPNKRTIQLAGEAALALARANRAARPGRELRKQAIEVLDEFMHAFAAQAIIHQPLPDGMAVPAGRKPDPEQFVKYGQLAVWAASQLAPYQSVKFRAIAVVAPQDPGGGSMIDQSGKPVDLPTDAQSLMRAYIQAIAPVKG